jgi:hypothetical protein
MRARTRRLAVLESERILSPRDLLKLWRDLRRLWEESLEDVVRELTAIPDPDRRTVALDLLRLMIAGKTELIADPCPNTYEEADCPLRILRLDVETSAADDALLLSHDPLLLCAAFGEIGERIHHFPAPLLVWAFRRLALSEPAIDDRGDPINAFMFDRVICSLATAPTIPDAIEILHPLTAYPPGSRIPARTEIGRGLPAIITLGSEGEESGEDGESAEGMGFSGSDEAGEEDSISLTRERPEPSRIIGISTHLRARVGEGEIVEIPPDLLYR